MEKEYIVTLILGLLIAAIAFGFITSNEGNNSNVEVCRQSVIVRDAIPNVQKGSFTVYSLKEEYPLNCETDVLEIDYENKDKATSEILDSIIECWYMFGNGKLNPLTSDISGSTCSVCTRVHFDKKVQEYYINNPINMKEALSSEWKNDISYKTYLTAKVDDNPQNYYILTDSYDDTNILSNNKEDDRTKFSLPLEVDVSKGDFFITFRYFRYEKNYHYADILFFPYDDGKPFELLVESGLDQFVIEENLGDTKKTRFPVCKIWEGVPA